MAYAAYAPYRTQAEATGSSGREEAAMAIETRTRPEVALVARLPRKLFIGGAWVDAETDATFETVDPAPGRVLANLPAGTAGDVDRAVRAARAAFEESWRD